MSLAFPTTTALSCTPNPLLLGTGADPAAAVTVTDNDEPAAGHLPVGGSSRIGACLGTIEAHCEELLMTSPHAGDVRRRSYHASAAAGTPDDQRRRIPGDANHDSKPRHRHHCRCTQPGKRVRPGPSAVPGVKKCKKKKHNRSASAAKKKCKKKKRALGRRRTSARGAPGSSAARARPGGRGSRAGPGRRPDRTPSLGTAAPRSRAAGSAPRRRTSRSARPPCASRQASYPSEAPGAPERESAT